MTAALRQPRFPSDSLLPKESSMNQPNGPRSVHLSTPTSVRKRGVVWLGAALLAAVLQADL